MKRVAFEYAVHVRFKRPGELGRKIIDETKDKGGVQRKRADLGDANSCWSTFKKHLRAIEWCSGQSRADQFYHKMVQEKLERPGLRDYAADQGTVRHSKVSMSTVSGSS